MLTVSRPRLPSRKRLECYLNGIYSRGCLTNNGPLLEELTERLKQYLGVDNLLLVSNGTLALQVAYRTLGIGDNCEQSPEAITTPFSFVATSSSLKWEGIQPIFSDIDPATWCLDPTGLEQSITAVTRAIVPVHVFGNGCNVEAIQSVAEANGLKVVYDGAHAFGVRRGGGSLLTAGDATTLSFHATKLFHAIEGGAIVFKRKEDLERASRMINFGISRPDAVECLGINAKLSEFQAAMGLCVLDEIEAELARRAEVWQAYMDELPSHLVVQQRNPECTNNYAYFPVLFDCEASLLEATRLLAHANIQTRRYFYPSLDTLRFLGDADGVMSISRDIASRILCLPMHSGVEEPAIDTILTVLK